MNMSYNILLELVIKHEFYIDEICPDIRVFFSDGDRQTLFRRSMIFKQVAVNKWLLLTPTTMNAAGYSEEITFHFQIINPTFVECTYVQDKQNALHLEKFKFEISEKSIRDAVNGKHIVKEFCFQSKKSYWKYLYTPDNEFNNDNKIKLVDQTHQLEFKQNTTTDANGQTIIFFISTKPIKLKQVYNYQLQLIEERAHGDKILKQHLPYPQIGSYDFTRKKDDEHDTLARYIY